MKTIRDKIFNSLEGFPGWEGTQYVNCTFQGLVWRRERPSGQVSDCRFYSCEFHGCNLNDLTLSGCILRDFLFQFCHFGGFGVQGCVLSSGTFNLCELGFMVRKLEGWGNVRVDVAFEACGGLEPENEDLDIFSGHENENEDED